MVGRTGWYLCDGGELGKTDHQVLDTAPIEFGTWEALAWQSGLTAAPRWLQATMSEAAPGVDEEEAVKKKREQWYARLPPGMPPGWP